jgi:hypothetical protein
MGVAEAGEARALRVTADIDLEHNIAEFVESTV